MTAGDAGATTKPLPAGGINQPLPAGALQNTGRPQAPTSEPSGRAQPTATTVGSGQPLGSSAAPADPMVPMEQAANTTAEAAQPETVGSPPEGGHLAPGADWQPMTEVPRPTDSVAVSPDSAMLAKPASAA